MSLQKRRDEWNAHKPQPRYTRGVLAKYAKLVSDASHGCITDKEDTLKVHA